MIFKNFNQPKIKGLRIVFLYLLFFSSCQTLNLEEPTPDLKINFFTAPDGTYSNSSQLKATIRESENFHIGLFGSGGQITSLLLTDEIEKKESVVLLDNQGSPAFIYGVNTQTGEKSESLMEFEPIEQGSFFMRIYQYDWEQRIGTLLVEAKATKSGEEWDLENTFLTKNTDLEGVSSRVGGKGGSFYVPIPRLDRLQLRKSGELATQDAVADFITFFDNFRQQDIPNFLKTEVGIPLLLASAVGGAAVAASLGSASIGTLLAGAGIGVGMAIVATTFIQSGGLERLIERLRNLNNTLTNGVNTLREGIVEVVDNFQVPASEYWNDLNLDIDGQDILEQILSEIRDEDVLSDPEDLDDLPDSQGVIHVAMNWNTDGTDIDLWVTDPNGERIWYSNPTSNSGGYLDRDDLNGFGPENIYWMSGAPDGTYQVSVDYYSCGGSCPPTTVVVKISNGLGTVRTYQGVLNTSNRTASVVSFTKQGSEILF